MALAEKDKKDLAKKNKRLALVLALIALSFYLFFVLSHL
jgi:uncharacterized membrane protein (DUF485 family)